jgi:hypothetical protein
LANKIYYKGKSFGGTGVGEFTNKEENSEKFNDYVYNKSTGQYSHAEGFHTTASGNHSHAEGFYSTASGQYSHVEGS